MDYYIKEIGRSVTLAEDLAETYTQFDGLDESLFLIPIYSMLHHMEVESGRRITADSLSNEELAEICNRAIEKELEMYTLIKKLLRPQ